MFVLTCICRNQIVSSRYDTAVGIWLPPYCVLDRYMHVYVYIYIGIWMYMQVYSQYLYVLYVLEHWGTETTTASPKHTLVTQNPREPTQGTPGHVPDHF